VALSTEDSGRPLPDWYHPSGFRGAGSCWQLLALVFFDDTKSEVFLLTKWIGVMAIFTVTLLVK
jgi:hypothetical protein